MQWIANLLCGSGAVPYFAIISPIKMAGTRLKFRIEARPQFSPWTPVGSGTLLVASGHKVIRKEKSPGVHLLLYCNDRIYGVSSRDRMRT